MAYLSFIVNGEVNQQERWVDLWRDKWIRASIRGECVKIESETPIFHNLRKSKIPRTMEKRLLKEYRVLQSLQNAALPRFEEKAERGSV
jgi:hypothetical protein